MSRLPAKFTDYSTEERKEIMGRIIAEYAKGVYSLTGVCANFGIAPNTLRNYLKRYDELRTAFHEATQVLAATHDDVVRHTTRKKIEERLSGRTKKSVEQVVITGRLAVTGAAHEATWNEADGEDAFERVMRLVGKLEDVTVQATVRRTTVPAGDALLIAAANMYDAGE